MLPATQLGTAKRRSAVGTPFAPYDSRNRAEHDCGRRPVALRTFRADRARFRRKEEAMRLELTYMLRAANGCLSFSPHAWHTMDELLIPTSFAERRARQTLVPETLDMSAPVPDDVPPPNPRDVPPPKSRPGKDPKPRSVP
jgi:hypothetical protein